MTIPSRHEPRPLSTALIILCMLITLHLCLAPTLSHVPLLTRSAPIQFPFLLFMSGFLLVHFSPSCLSINPYAPQRFYLNSLVLLFPVHAAFVCLHALIFSTSSHPLRRALLTVFFLSPISPPSLAFPIRDAPLVVQNLIPALLVCVLIFPIVLQILPRANTPNRLHLLFAVVATYATTVIQAHWLSNLPTLSNPRRIFFTDILATIPFLLHLPAFLFGVASALAYRAFLEPHAPRSPTVLTIRFIGALFAVVTSLIVSSRRLPDSFETLSFFSAWTVTGLLLPLLAIAAFTASDFCVIDISSLSTVSLSDFGFFATHGVGIGVTFYASVLFVYRALASVLCFRSAHSMTLSSCASLPAHQDPKTMLIEATSRLFSITPTPQIHAPFVLFLLTSIVLTLTLYVTVVAPMTYVLLRCIEVYDTSGHYPTHFRILSTSTIPRSLPTFVFNTKKTWNSLRSLPDRIVAVRVVVYITALVTFFVSLYRFSIPFGLSQSKVPDTVFRRVLNALRWLVSISLLPMLFNLTGHLLFPRVIWQKLPCIEDIISVADTHTPECGLSDGGGESPTRVQLSSEHHLGYRLSLDEQRCSKPSNVMKFCLYLRYVTRGQNRRLVAENVKRAVQIFDKCKLPRRMWRIEVVTDQSVGLNEHRKDGIVELVVPKEFSCSTGALYKARALNYAIKASDARLHDWIVHLDEETRFDADCIHAILVHCSRETTKTFVKRIQRWPRVGQGLILYGNWLVDDSLEETSGGDAGNWITTLADCGRVADDCGRYRLQYEYGDALIGMHGSFVVVCNNVEQEVTFDHGVAGSIAEDAFFAMVARVKGVQFAWIDAMMEERSPLTILDFMKQRARWLVGGLLVAQSGQLPLRIRWVLGVLVSIWFLSPLAYAMGIAAIFWSGGSKWDPSFLVLLSSLTILSIWNYVLGFCVTFSVSQLGPIRFFVLLYFQILLTPFLGLMEMASVCYGAWNFKGVSKGFHVIQKEVETAKTSSIASEALTCGEKTPLLV